MPYEEHLALNQDSIGCCKSFTFDLELVDRLPELPRAIEYPPEQRAWIKKEAQTLCGKGVWEKVENVEFTS